MAGEPKRRHSKARKRTRRAAINLAVNLVHCSSCGKLTIPHTICKQCGFYRSKAAAKEKVQITRA